MQLQILGDIEYHKRCNVHLNYVVDGSFETTNDSHIDGA